MITRLNVGGPAIQAILLTERLDPTRYECLLVTGAADDREGDMLALRHSGAVQPIVIPRLGRRIAPLGDVVAFFQLVALLRRFRPDIVHTHLAKAGLLGRIAGRIAGARVVVHTFHGNVLRGYFGVGTSALLRMIERLLGRISTRIVAISPEQVDELVRLGIVPPARIALVPLGLDLAPFLEAETGRLRAELAAGDAPLVGIVARLVPIKAVDLFLEAAARVRAARQDARFVVLGDGPDRERLQERAARGDLVGSVRFLGWRADLPSVYADLDVVVLTSRNEGTPVSLIEALAAGRACVATNVGGVRDLLGDDERGIVVPAGNSEAIGRAILHLLNAPDERRTLGERGRSFVHPAYDTSTLIDRVDTLYRELLDARSKM